MFKTLDPGDINITPFKVGKTFTLTNADSGKVYMCSSADGAFSITRPTASTGLDGVHYKFIVWEETPTADITIALGSAIGSGVNKDAGGDAAN